MLLTGSYGPCITFNIFKHTIKYVQNKYCIFDIFFLLIMKGIFVPDLFDLLNLMICSH